jgi:SAM-dependent methyltransferase
MVMDDPRGVAEYDRAGETFEVPFHHVNALALSRLAPEGGTLLDLGCGSARLLARLARGRPDLHIVGIDLSEPMLETGQALLVEEDLLERVELRHGDITTFDAELSLRPDVVCCNLALHQLPSEELVLRCLEAIGRVRERSGCGVYVFDLARLRNKRSWPTVTSVLADAGPLFVRDAIASERAAFTLAELTGLLDQAGLGDLRHAAARPLGEYQVHWAPTRRAGAPGVWHDVPLPRGTRLSTQLTRRSFPSALMRA